MTPHLMCSASRSMGVEVRATPAPHELPGGCLMIYTVRSESSHRYQRSGYQASLGRDENDDSRIALSLALSDSATCAALATHARPMSGPRGVPRATNRHDLTK